MEIQNIQTYTVVKGKFYVCHCVLCKLKSLVNYSPMLLGGLSSTL